MHQLDVESKEKSEVQHLHEASNPKVATTKKIHSLHVP